MVGVLVDALLRFLPATLDVTAWYGQSTLLVAVLVLVVAVWGFRVSLAGQPLFRDEIQAA